jgi:hypothetical protein
MAVSRAKTRLRGAVYRDREHEHMFAYPLRWR